MHYHLTDIQLLLGGFTLVLMSIFAVAACLDGRWRKASQARSFQSQLDSKLVARETGSLPLVESEWKASNSAQTPSQARRKL